MSRTSGEVTRAWDSYVSEAALPDFVLQTSDGEVRFTNPSATALLRITQGVRQGDLDAILLGLAGDNYPRMMELMSQAGHDALSALVEDLMEHFRLYDEYRFRSPDGGRTVTLTRPTDIRAKLRENWTPVGELPAWLA